MDYYSTSMRHRAFTLIELLVVVMIIMLLAGLLLPALRAIRQRSIVTACEAEVQQLKVALSNYRSDFGDYPPSSLDVIGGSAGGTNEGNETMTACLASTIHGDSYIKQYALKKQLKNLDNDSAPGDLTGWFYPDNELYEYTDRWGTPYIYFHNRDYGKTRSYTIKGRPTPVTAARDDAGRPLAFTEYQLWSCGPDQEDDSGENDRDDRDDINSWGETAD